MKKLSRFLILYCLIIIFLATGISYAQTPVKGQVVSIADGDTITVLQDSKQHKIRLYGIDTPERKQDFGRQARLFTSRMLFRQYVKVVAYDKDRYGRTVGLVYVEKKCLNEELIKNGFAWVDKKYCTESFCNRWLLLERRARVSKLGLWLHDNPIPPWDFRKGKSSNSRDKIPGEYHGNLKSLVFHASDCKHFNCKNCTRVFPARKAAIKSGYKPCGICNLKKKDNNYDRRTDPV